MNTYPLEHPCNHVASPQERDRDPTYQACTAQSGQPCRWATRYDGLTDPHFHSERLEAAAQRAQFAEPQDTLDPQAFDQAVLASGLV